MNALRRLAIHPPTLAFAALALGVVSLRALVLTEPAAPSGVDGGNWLAFGHALFGDSVRSSEIVYPPLVPLMAVLATGAFGLTAGFGLLASFTSIAPAAAVFGALRYARLEWAAVVAAGPLLASASVGEAAAWGGYPQLLALAFLAAFTASVDRHMRWPTPRTAAATGAFLFLALASSHLFAPMVLTAGAATVGLHLVFVRDPAYRATHQRGLLLLVAAGLPSLLLVPLYLQLANTVLDTVTARAPGDRLAGRGAVSVVEFIYREFPLYWRAAIVLTLLVPILLWHRRATRAWVLTVAALFSVAAAFMGFREPRFAYAVPVVASLGVGIWLHDLATLARRAAASRAATAAAAAATAIAIAALGWNVRAGLELFEHQRDYYRVATTDVLSAARWIESRTDRRAVVAVNSVNDWPAGWWVEGLARRHTLSASSLKWLNFEDERRRAAVANTIFTDLFPTEATLERARQGGAHLLFIFKADERYRSWMLDELRRRKPRSVVFDSDDAAVVSTGLPAP